MTPNLFLIGAPKCGTSSLFDWLSSHPDIHCSRVKEPFALIDPKHPLARRPSLAIDGPSVWESFFDLADSAAPIRMEGTTHYLFDPFAREAIASIKGARVIVVLREPAARVYSSFRYTANNLARLVPGMQFARYLDLIRRGVPLYPDWCSHPGSAFVLERDLEYSRYVRYIKPWSVAMGSENVRVVLMETMLRDPSATIADLIRWLGLDPGKLPTLNAEGRNRTERVSSPQLQALAHKINAKLRMPAPLRGPIKRVYAALQFRPNYAISPEDAQELKALRAGFGADNAALGRLLDIDLSLWSEAIGTPVNSR